MELLPDLCWKCKSRPGCDIYVPIMEDLKARSAGRKFDVTLDFCPNFEPIEKHLTNPDGAIE